MSFKSENILESNSTTTENSFEENDSLLGLKKETKKNQFDFLVKNKNISEQDYILNISRVIEDLVSESQANPKKLNSEQDNRNQNSNSSNAANEANAANFFAVFHIVHKLE